MPNPVTSRGTDPRAPYPEPEPEPKLLCESPIDASGYTDADDPRADLLPPASGGNASCGVGCGVATAVACGGLSVAAGTLLSPTGVGVLAGAVLGIDCSIAATLFCAQVCK